MDIGPDMSEEEKRVRVLIEKKTVLNLVDAFCVSVKHYLRGESSMMCTLTIFMAFNNTSPQTFITRTYITRPNIFQHMGYQRVYHPLTILQAICLLLRSLSRSNSTNRLLSNAALPMTVARGLFLQAVIMNVHSEPCLGQLPTSPCPPLLLERLKQKLKSPEFLSSRSRLDLPKVTKVYMAPVLVHWAKPSCSQHAIPRNIHTSTFSLSLLWSSSSPSVVGSLRAEKLPLCGQNCNIALKTCHLKFRSILCVFPFRWKQSFYFSMTPQSSYIAALQNRKCVDATTTCMWIV